MKKNDRLGLCWRCEYRAQNFETGRQPRCECGDIKSAKYSCYMYRPVCPAVLAVDENDHRKDLVEQFAPWIIAPRSHIVRVPDNWEMRVYKEHDGSVAYWIPPNDDEAA